MMPSVLRVEVVSPTLVEVTPPAGEFATLTQFFSNHGLLAMRQADCVAVEGSWRTVLSILAGYDGDPWLSEVVEEPAVVG